MIHSMEKTHGGQPDNQGRQPRGQGNDRHARLYQQEIEDNARSREPEKKRKKTNGGQPSVELSLYAPMRESRDLPQIYGGKQGPETEGQPPVRQWKDQRAGAT